MLITGGAGFIGAHLSAELTRKGEVVTATDAMRDYYAVSLKELRVLALSGQAFDKQYQVDLGVGAETIRIGDDVSAVIHLAAQPGVRIPLERYGDYERDNLASLANVLRLVRTLPGNPLLMIASSSSVYGDAQPPFREESTVLSPTSYYGSTKVVGEAMAKAFAEQTGIPTIALRFFTAYGPWGRPDMAYFRIAAAAATGGTFSLYGDGRVRRDFTYIDDIVSSIIDLMHFLESVKGPYFEAVNIGGGRPVSMNELIDKVSKLSGGSLQIEHSLPDSRDAAVTEADFTKLQRLTGRAPTVDIDTGLARVWDWATSAEVTPRLAQWVDSTLSQGRADA